MTNKTSISFVRHGHVFNPQNILYGRLPGFRLSELGHRQAEAAAAALQNKPLAAIFCSPQPRARQTAEIILASRNGLSLSMSPLLDEIYTPYEGQPISELAALEWDIYSGIDPQYEQPQDILARMQRFVAGVRRRYAGQHVVAVTHGDNILFMMFWVRGFPVAGADIKRRVIDLDLPDLYPVPASITTFVYQTAAQDEVPRFEYVNPYG